MFGSGAQRAGPGSGLGEWKRAAVARSRHATPAPTTGIGHPFRVQVRQNSLTGTADADPGVP